MESASRIRPSSGKGPPPDVLPHLTLGTPEPLEPFEPGDAPADALEPPEPSEPLDAPPPLG
ncbi:MAG: hypothetical protein LBR53_05465 [Deltaproteobacteria bacterium]|nr:hypothetical protein [Deltaproteobacteria bacterium]